jgi:hypothetical protein
MCLGSEEVVAIEVESRTGLSGLHARLVDESSWAGCQRPDEYGGGFGSGWSGGRVHMFERE